MAGIASGCGFGGFLHRRLWGGGGPDPNTIGTVTGWVAEIDGGDGVVGARITIGGRSGVSTAPVGQFAVSGIPQGHRQIIVNPPAPFELVSDEPMYCDVIGGQAISLFDPILVISSGSLPPAPHSD